MLGSPDLWGTRPCASRNFNLLVVFPLPLESYSFFEMEVHKSSFENEKEVALEHLETTAGANDGKPEILRNHSREQLAALEKKLVRKIDIRALPILIILFLLNVLDRNAIANARLGGLEDSLGIDDVQYQTAVMVLWAGYISMMIPSNMVLSIVKPRIYLPTVVIVWGIVSGATGFVQNHAGLVALRFLVGATEAPYFPGCKSIFLYKAVVNEN